MVWTRTYSSMNAHDGPMGPGWSVTYIRASDRQQPRHRTGRLPEQLRQPARQGNSFRGRVIKKRCLESESRWSYTYDSDNRLIQVEQSAPSGFKRTRFSYDALGRRTGKYDGVSQTVFIWNGMKLLREENSQKAVTYFYEQGGYVPLARVDGHNAFAEADSSLADPESVYYYHCNVAGLPEDVTDSDGRLIWRGRYSTL